MDSDKYCRNISENFREIIEKYGEDFWLYMNNDPKHISIKSLEWYKEKQIKIENRPIQPLDSNPRENIWRVVKIIWKRSILITRIA